MRWLLVIAVCGIGACSTQADLRLRHGSPLHTFQCDAGKTFQSRQIISGEVEVTAGGETRDATDAGGDPVPGGPRISQVGEQSTLTGMPGGPYESCRMID